MFAKESAWNAVRVANLLLTVMSMLPTPTIQVKFDVAPDQIEALHRYDTLHVDDVTHEISRGSESSMDHHRHVRFSTLGRQFHLHLRVNQGLFHRQFSAHAVMHDGQRIRKSVDISRFYRGVIEGDDDDSHVTAHVDDLGRLTATIHARDGVYTVEPSWRHISRPHNFHMIAYRDEDIKPTRAPFCGLNNSDFTHDHEHSSLHSTIRNDLERWQFDHTSSPDAKRPRSEHRRLRRQAITTGRVCLVTLVADHFFYKQMGNNDFSVAATTMISQLNIADGIFRKTTWSGAGQGLVDYGLQVKELIVHMSFTASPNHYNSKNPQTVRNLLKAFSYGDWDTTKEVCLAHLFTSLGFDNNVLGLAYVASPDVNSIGGICTRVYQTDRWLNVGLSTSKNCRDGNEGDCRTLISREFQLVTAHEIGHNWGSQHDVVTQCVSTAAGRYLMNTFALPGTEPNNNLLSPCSRSSIGSVLQSKERRCFTDRRERICGNGLVESGEDCDPGLDPKDKCCYSHSHVTKACQFKVKSYSCSDVNDVCCLNCQLRNSSFKCREPSTESDLSCLEAGYCDGRNRSCPVGYKTSGRCGDNGQCKKPSKDGDSRCQTYCQIIRQRPCLCSSKEHECHVCCRDQETGTCKAVMNGTSFIDIQVGKPCAQGFCYDGRCEQAAQDANEKFWNIFSSLSADDVARWFRDNIVAAVLVCTFIPWVIGGMIVRHYDKQRMMSFNEQFDNYDRRRRERKQAMRMLERKAANVRRDQGRVVTQPEVDDEFDVTVTTPLTSPADQPY